MKKIYFIVLLLLIPYTNALLLNDKLDQQQTQSEGSAILGDGNGLKLL